MMLQTLKKQNFNISLSKKLLTNSLVALCATGLFAVNGLGKDLSSEKDKSLLLKPVDNLSNEEYDTFMLGKSFFRIPWVEAPSATTARDGLGPLFNSNTCISCHPGNGKGVLYNSKGNFSRSLIPKLSIKSSNEKYKKVLETKGLIPEPTYGVQVALNAIHGVKFEAKSDIKYQEKKIEFPDGEVAILLKPIYALKDLQYGELHKDAVLTFRLAPTLNGLGLLSDISDEEILKNEDEFDKDADGISGKANYIFSPITKKVELGRYSWKASTSSLLHQTADAANNDMGLKTIYYPKDTCTEVQTACKKAPKPKDEFDITKQRLEAITFYLKKRKTYSVDKSSNEYKKGFAIFKQIGCNKCHIDSFTTKSGVKISPFTDLLLHDMGDELADGREEFKATGNEWRTPALWGLALHEKINAKKPRLLHDGRARDFQEAILWHGGEAQSAKENYINLEKKQREELIKFLEEV